MPIIRNLMVMKITLRRALLVLFLLTELSACIPKQLHYSYTPSNATCSVNLSWKSIHPGISTRRDVLRLLGTPTGQGWTKYDDGSSIQYYSYKIEGGEISKFLQHRIYFQPNGNVAWIEETVADFDGHFHTVRETVDQLGDTLDAAYNNTNANPFGYQIDVLGGPDQILVWSECGMALVALMDLKVSATGELEYSRVAINDPQILKFRYPEFNGSSFPVKDLDRVVMMKFLFPPTSFENYLEKYSFRIRFGLWDDFLKNRQK